MFISPLSFDVYVGGMLILTLVLSHFKCVQDSELDYECVLVIEGQTVVVDAYVEIDDINPSSFDITCQLHEVILISYEFW